MSVEQAVARAVRAKLAADLTALCPVYDHPPDNAAMPFVTFDRHMVQPADPVSTHMSRHQITLTVWSEARGVKQVRGIIGAIRESLHHADLTLSDGSAVLVEVERTDATRDNDGKTYMGSALIAVLTEND